MDQQLHGPRIALSIMKTHFNHRELQYAPGASRQPSQGQASISVEETNSLGPRQGAPYIYPTALPISHLSPSDRKSGVQVTSARKRYQGHAWADSPWQVTLSDRGHSAILEGNMRKEKGLCLRSPNCNGDKHIQGDIQSLDTCFLMKNHPCLIESPD